MKSEKKPLIIITGPTAAGKTALSVALAKALDGEIISADSMQVYKHMDIGTAKATREEMAGIKHYLIDCLEPFEEFNVVRFKQMAQSAMNEIEQKGKLPVLVGGTGFYIQALLYDVDFTENDGDTAYRQELEQLAREQGAEYLHELLRTVDEKSAQDIHANNVKRVIRALEFYRQTGIPISAHNERQRQNSSPYDFMYFVLTDDRKLLYERIEKRIDVMLAAGLVDEAASLIKMGCTRDMVSMQGIGYREFFDYFEGKASLSETIERLRLDTRHFAKRQLTWFKREKNVIWMDYREFGHDKNKLLQDMLRRIGAHYGNE